MSEGKRFYPLDSNEAQSFEEAAHDDEFNFLTRLTGRSLFYLGLRPITYTHTVPEWIVRRGKNLMLDITPYSKLNTNRQKCTKGAGELGEQNPDGADLYDRGEPCWDCRKYGETDGFDGKTSNTPRVFTFNSPELQQLGKDFEWYFEENDTIPFGQDGVNRRVRKIAEKAGIGETRGYKTTKSQGRVVDINAYDLRHTFGTRLARMGYNKYEIKAEMGHGSTNMPEKYIEFTGVRKREVQDEKWDPDVY